MHSLLLLGGELPTGELLVREAEAALRIIAADGAANHAFRHGLRLDQLVGDLDSVEPIVLEHCRASGTEITTVPEQENNDFEKALRLLAPDGQTLRILGLTGGRTDHLMANLSVLARYAGHFAKITALDAHAEYHLLGERNVSLIHEAAIGTTVSLIPLHRAEGLTTTGLRYALEEATLAMGEREGLSNVTTERRFTVSLRRGVLLVAVSHK